MHRMAYPIKGRIAMMRADSAQPFRYQGQAERRLGALDRHFNDCFECMRIVRFCVRGAKRARTFAVAAQAAWMVGSGRRRA
jgi:hypothetical protein